MLPNLLERINPDEMDQHNLAQRHLSRQDAIFSLYPNQPIVSVLIGSCKICNWIVESAFATVEAGGGEGAKSTRFGIQAESGFYASEITP